jgi:hypothetical protein
MFFDVPYEPKTPRTSIILLDWRQLVILWYLIYGLLVLVMVRRRR